MQAGFDLTVTCLPLLPQYRDERHVLPHPAPFLINFCNQFRKIAYRLESILLAAKTTHCLHLLPVWANILKSTVPVSQVSEQNSLAPAPDSTDGKEAQPCLKEQQSPMVTSNRSNRPESWILETWS